MRSDTVKFGMFMGNCLALIFLGGFATNFLIEKGETLFDKEQVAAVPAPTPVQKKKGHIIEGEYDNWLPGHVYGSKTKITFTQPTPKTLQWTDREGNEHKAYLLGELSDLGGAQLYYREYGSKHIINWNYNPKNNKTLVMRYLHANNDPDADPVWVGRNLKGETHRQLFEDFVGL